MMSLNVRGRAQESITGSAMKRKHYPSNAGRGWKYQVLVEATKALSELECDKS